MLVVGKTETFTLGEFGYNEFYEEVIESWIQQDYEQWLFDNIDSGWSLEDE